MPASELWRHVLVEVGGRMREPEAFLGREGGGTGNDRRDGSSSNGSCQILSPLFKNSFLLSPLDITPPKEVVNVQGSGILPEDKCKMFSVTSYSYSSPIIRCSAHFSGSALSAVVAGEKIELLEQDYLKAIVFGGK